jgi:hypothetical protein
MESSNLRNRLLSKNWVKPVRNGDNELNSKCAE